MSFDVSPVAVSAPAQQAQTQTAAAAQEAAATDVPETEAAVSVQLATLPPSPPPEVRHAIAVASDSYDRLHDSGRQLSFSLDDGSGALTVELQDLSGNHISTLSVSDALRIAGGANPN